MINEKIINEKMQVCCQVIKDKLKREKIGSISFVN